MGLPTPVSFRTSQPNAAAILPAAPQKADAARDQDQFERHLDDNQTQGSSSADRREANRRADRRDQDRAAKDRADNARDTQKANSDSDTVPQTENDPKGTDTTELAAAPADTQAREKDGAKPAASGTAKSTTDTISATDTAPPQTAKAADPKADQNQDAAATSDASKVADTTPKPKTDKTKKTDEASTDLAGLAATTVVKAAETRKTETKPSSTEPKIAAAPVPAAIAPLTADAANTTPKAQVPQPTTGNADPEANLAISSKDGLGREAATKTADKNDAKNATAQATGPNAPTQAQAAPTASTTTQNFAKMVAAASGGEVSAVTSAGNGSSGTNALSDLQNLANTTQSQNTNPTVRIGTLPGQTTPTQVPAMAIALQVARNLQKGINRFDIRLDPAEMGRIDVRMDVKKDGSVATHMIVERPETLELLRRDATALQQALNNAGLQANPDSLNFSLRDGNTGNQPQSFANTPQGSSGLSNFESSSDNVVLSPIYNINTSANGGIDIRV